MIKIVQKKLSKNRVDSFWYDGLIAYEDTDHGRYCVVAVGEIKVMFEPDGDWHKNSQAVDKALEMKLTDRHLNKLNEHDGWGNNNWFEILFEDLNGNVSGLDVDSVSYEYDEAIESLRIAVQEQLFKK